MLKWREAQIYKDIVAVVCTANQIVNNHNCGQDHPGSEAALEEVGLEHRPIRQVCKPRTTADQACRRTPARYPISRVHDPISRVHDPISRVKH